MSSRNRLSFQGFVLEKLQCHDDIAAFDCGDPDLNDYFRNDSINYRSELMTQTYCFHREGETQKEAVALIDFCNDSLARNLIPKCNIKQINHQKRGYKSFPALKITRLGVDAAMHGHCIGTLLLCAAKEFFTTDNRTGCRFLTVDAYRDAQGFYIRNDFVLAQLPEEDDDPKSPTVPMLYDLWRIASK